jgi:aminopeptidase N
MQRVNSSQTVKTMQKPNQKSLKTVSVIMIVVAFSALTTFALRRERLIDAWRPTNYNVAITLNDSLTEITQAQTDIDIVALKPLRVIDLDFGEMKTDSVTLHGKPVPFLHQNGKLQITLPATIAPKTNLQISVTYHGRPKDGLILSKDKDGMPSVVGDNWPDRVHHWIPCFDHPSAKATITFNVSAPNRDIVVANGRLTKVETNNSGRKTWTYSESVPIPPYCMIIGVGEFARIEAPQSPVSPLSFYVPQSDAAYAPKGFSSAGPALQMFNETVGPYPYEKLALIIGATQFGGMENSSAIVFTSTLFNPNPNQALSKAFDIRTGIEDVVAHEIAHQWFGDSVTESTWADLWLSEGFATYFAGLFIQKHEGEEAFQRYLKGAADTAFGYEQKNRIPIHDRDTQDLFKLLNGNNYQKGAWVLHMLRSRLGDEAFFQGIRSYYQQHKNSIASTEDLRLALEKASGKDLQTFFTRWVYDSGHPQYDVQWSWQANSKRLDVVVTQKQPGAVFVDEIPLEVSTAGGTRSFTLRPRAKRANDTFQIDEQPTSIAVDPKNTLLKEVTVSGN